MRPQWAALSKLKQTSAQVVAQVVEVGMHGVGSPPEVQVVRKVDGSLALETVGHLQRQADELSPHDEGQCCAAMGVFCSRGRVLRR